MATEAPSRRAAITARVFSLVALGAFLSGVAGLGVAGYRAATDSFVAPIILSPDNDHVLGTKLQASQLAVERARTATTIGAIDQELAAGKSALVRLEELRAAQGDPKEWMVALNRSVLVAGASELRSLDREHGLLVEMLGKQRALVASAEANVEANLLPRVEYVREVQSLRQLEVAVLDNDRARVKSRLQATQAMLARSSLSGSGPMMPEVAAREEQRVRVELEIVRLASELRAKTAERGALADKLFKIDELEGQLRSRPIYRAIDKTVEVAFVPYTQIQGVRRGAPVYDCTWGLFRCRVVGEIAEVVPGEVVLPDPWGSQARGQYAILDLTDHAAARSKMLRVRGATTGAAPRESAGAFSGR